MLRSYEVHLAEEVRRKGLGKFLMQILELLAARYYTTFTDECIWFQNVTTSMWPLIKSCMHAFIVCSFQFCTQTGTCVFAFPEQR